MDWHLNMPLRVRLVNSLTYLLLEAVDGGEDQRCGTGKLILCTEHVRTLFEFGSWKLPATEQWVAIKW